jgi:molecular chaperone Hsp33
MLKMDHMIIATAWNDKVRVLATVTTELAETARKKHDLWPTAAAVMGRALTGGLLMGANLKESQKLTLRFLGDGPCGAVIVDSNVNGEVRGYMQEPHVDLPPTAAGKIDVGSAVGKGSLIISKDLGFGDPYTGQVPLQTGEIAADIAYYFAISEQTPTAIGLGVLVDPDGSVNTAGGYMVQMMPGATEEDTAELEHRLHHLASPTEIISEKSSAEHILHQIFHPDEVRILETRTVSFQCNCNRDRLSAILGSLEIHDLQDMIDQNQPIEMICHFCREKYYFEQQELVRILNEKASIS